MRFFMYPISHLSGCLFYPVRRLGHTLLGGVFGFRCDFLNLAGGFVHTGFGLVSRGDGGLLGIVGRLLEIFLQDVPGFLSVFFGLVSRFLDMLPNRFGRGLMLMCKTLFHTTPF